MKRSCVVVALLVVLTVYPGFAQSVFDSLLTLKVAPGVNVPLGGDSLLFRTNYGGRISGEIAMPFFPVLYASVGLGYNYVPLKTAATDLSLMAFGGGIGLDFNPIPLISVRVFGGGG